ncbi:hypothetical protein D1164_02430 [Mariniphaga sediminis]|uniref:Uncharacterized protein n=2 Tax=Mariniphaga sediminis TaxID=1628158 RepID=A0A399CXX7_9BACT|nr:hypothetical protein D1164_15380 [Mariniphaga sediminis]RIH66486.1 hypothetical protein D1164_02430 [Mariniphaga sediminis]
MKDMDIKTEKRAIESSGRFPAENRPPAFSFRKLSDQSGALGFDIFTLARNEEQILEQLLLQLEKELKEIVDETASAQDAPAAEFEMLFRHLYQLFKQKPYYLTVIFDKDLHRKYNGAEKIISRIKGVAKGYLTRLIDRGKAQNIFIIHAETKILVRKILNSFQVLMNDMQLAEKMIRDLRKYQSIAD